MAARKGRSYVYLIKDGDLPVYVGKGTGRRSKVSCRKHGGDVVVLEDGLSDSAAFKRERHWISELAPCNNRSFGGEGGRSRPKPKARRSSEEAEMARVGAQVFAARFLLTKLDEANCETFGVSKVDLSRLREVADGCRS